MTDLVDEGVAIRNRKLRTIRERRERELREKENREGER